jgi:outer membrane protein assembly factor BamB
VVNGVVYETTIGEALRAYDAATGAVLWRTTAPLVSSPAFANGMIYSVYENTSTDYGVYAFDATTHKSVWQAPFGGFSQSDLAVANGTVYAGSFDGNLYAFDARTGAPKWSFKAGTEVDDAPAVANGVVYVASTENGVLYALNASSGASLWSAPATGHFMFSSPSVANGMVFIGSDDGKLYAYGLSGSPARPHLARAR